MPHSRAGCLRGLPSILIAKLYPLASVTATDYPDDALIQTLSDNLERNDVMQTCSVVPFAWGTNPAPVLRGAAKFDVVLAADTLWNCDLHEIFINALQMTLKKTAGARIHPGRRFAHWQIYHRVISEARNGEWI